MRLDSHLDFFDSLRIWGLVNCRSWILTWIKTPRWMDKMITVATTCPPYGPRGTKWRRPVVSLVWSWALWGSHTLLLLVLIH